MKKLRKIGTVLLVLAIALGLGGCGKMTAGKLVVKTAAALAETPMTSARMEAELEMSAGVLGVSLETGMAVNMDLVMSAEPYRAYLDTELVMSIFGQDLSQTMQTYIQSEGDALTTYTYAGRGWTKTVLEPSARETGGQLDLEWLKAKPVEELTLEEETRTVDGREVYVLSCTINGAELQQLLETMGNAGVSGETDISVLSVPAVFYIDAETFLPVRLELELRGMNEIVSEMIGKALEFDLSTLGLELEIDEVRILCRDLGYDPVEVPAVPQEAIGSAKEV